MISTGPGKSYNSVEEVEDTLNTQHGENIRFMMGFLVCLCIYILKKYCFKRKVSYERQATVDRKICAYIISETVNITD